MFRKLFIALLSVLLLASFSLAEESIKEGAEKVGEGVKEMGKATGKAL